MKNPYSRIFYAVDTSVDIFNLFSSLNNEKQGAGCLLLIIYLSCYLRNKCLFFSIFILFIIINIIREDHQIEITLSFKFHDIYHELKIN